MKELFTEKHPELLEELHPKKNTGVDLSKLYENSGLEVTWQCRKNSNHVWKQKIGNRAVRGYGCPYCSGRLTLPEDSFAALFPTIASELHPSKNNNFDPYRCRPNSNKMVWWLCENGHVWQQSIHHRVRRKIKCKLCRRIDNSFANRYPQIAKEWHPTKNKPLDPTQIGPSYKGKVWWKCSKNSSHEWQVSVSTRAFSKSTCPKCSKIPQNGGRLPPLSEYSPELTHQWHPTKNENLKPSDVTAGSKQKVWWICPNNPKHEWPATVSNRARKGRGCPKCCHQTTTKPENSLAVRFPNIAIQWHPSKNATFTPTNVSYGSSRNVWWQCPRKKSHEWQATVASRTQRNNDKCPKCPESRSSKDNTLQQAHPEIANQWHPTKNGGLSPDQVTRASGKIVWWLCPVDTGHEWEAQIKNRTILGSGCPHCFQEKNIIRLSEHLYDLTLSEIDCYHMLLSNLRILRKLSEQKFKDNQRLKQPYYRMIYSSVITSLETYLSDAFYKEVLDNKELLERLITTTPEFSKKQYSLTEVVDWHKNLKKKMTEYLFNIVWHNLPKIKNMYKSVLGVVFPEDISHLHKAVNIRHDLVHRHGRTKTGTMRNLNKKLILKLITDTNAFVDHINEQLPVKKTEQ